MYIKAIFYKIEKDKSIALNIIYFLQEILYTHICLSDPWDA